MLDGPAAGRLRLRILLALALAEFERSGLSAAAPLLREALDAAVESRDEELEALAHSQHAMALGRSGHLHEALAELERGVRLLRRLGPRDQWVMLINRGMVRSHLFDLRGARQDFIQAREVAQAAGLKAQEFMAAHNLGYAEYLAGDMPQALQLMAEADAIPVDVSRAAARLDRGRVLLEAGLETEAEEVLVGALAVCTDRRQQQIRGEIEIELARARLALGETRAALQLARSAQRRFSRREAPLWADRAHLLTMQVLIARSWAPRRVAQTAGALAERARSERDAALEAHASLLAAQALVVAGGHTEALPWLRRAAGLRRTGALSTRLLVAWVDARLAADSGDQRRATSVLTSAARELQSAQAGSASIDLRTAGSVHGRNLAELDLRLAASRGPAAVLARTELWRAATANLPVITPPADDQLAELLTRLRGVQEQIRDGDPQRRAPLRIEESRIQRRIRSRGWELSASHTEQRPTTGLSLPVLRDALGTRGTDLVSYFTQDGNLHEVSVRRGRPEMRHVGDTAAVTALTQRAHADMQAAALHGSGPLGAAIHASLTNTMQSLDRLLLGGSAGRERPVVVVPTALLSLLPWGMLPSRRGLPTTVATSARAWVAGARTVHRPRVRVVLGPDLTRATGESAEVAQGWSAASPTGPASAADLRSALGEADLVHVAAHGRHEPENPLFSSVRMADGPVFAHELANIGIRAAHVVLSACDVGRSTVRPGDEPLGLTAGLLYLGAAAVVAPSCRIPDDVAADAMTAYHAQLSRGTEAAEALAAATEHADPLARAFTVVGSPFRAVVDG